MKKKSNFIFLIILTSFAGIFILFYGILTVSNIWLNLSNSKAIKVQQEWYQSVAVDDTAEQHNYDYYDYGFDDGYNSGYDDGYSDGLADADITGDRY